MRSNPYSRRRILGWLIGGLITAVGWSYRATVVHAATCTGANPCNACKNCKYCKRCAEQGGTCGTCRKARRTT